MHRVQIVRALEPAFADIHLRPRISITGDNFAPTGLGKLVCSFGTLGYSNATFLSTKLVECISPKLQEGVLVRDWEQDRVEVATDGSTFSISGALFTYFRTPEVRQVIPASGSLQPLSLRVRGAHFFLVSQSKTHSNPNYRYRRKQRGQAAHAPPPASSE